MDALSTEWRRGTQYFAGDRVAFKLGDSLGVAAFECMQNHISNPLNQWHMGMHIGNIIQEGFPENVDDPFIGFWVFIRLALYHYLHTLYRSAKLAVDNYDVISHFISHIYSEITAFELYVPQNRPASVNYFQ